MEKTYKIVTRHPALCKFLKEEYGIEGEVLSHVSPDQIEGQNVIGVLPHSLSCLTESFTEVPLRLPPEMRGKELTVDDLRKYSSPMVTYKVTMI